MSQYRFPDFRVGYRRTQGGAVLYIALIMLILLTLIGLVGMRVASLQEKMSSNYRAVNLAFQNAEGFARATECGIEDVVNKTSTAGCNAAPDIAVCDVPFDPVDWAQNRTYADGESFNARLIGPCISGNSSLAMGRAVNEDPNPIYQVTAYSVDFTENPSGDAAIDTIFRP